MEGGGKSLEMGTCTYSDVIMTSDILVLDHISITYASKFCCISLEAMNP